MMTDAQRRPDAWGAASRLIAGSGVILRHYDDPARGELGMRLAKLARARRLVFLVAGDWRLAARLGAGLHVPQYMLQAGRLAPALGWARRRGVLVTAACHDHQALARAGRLGLGAALVSPVFATQSHPGAKGLGALGFARLVRHARLPVMALGGMTGKRAGHLEKRGCAGWAAV